MPRFNAYEVAHFRSHHREQVLELLRHLWGSDRAVRSGYFEWKYERNPHAETPLAVVALHAGTVVGFRGYFATRWKAGDGELIDVLCPGDTCVHDSHRRQGLSVAMGEFAMEAYAGTHRIFLNLSAGARSTPGYLRMGFASISNKGVANRYEARGLLRFLITARMPRVRRSRRSTPSTSGDLIVSRDPRPAEMAAVAAARAQPSQALALHQDEAFFRWRFGNRRNEYLFYYWMGEGRMTAYAAAGIYPGRRAGILDALGPDAAVRAILERIVAARHFNVLSVDRFWAGGTLGPTLQALGFRSCGLLPSIERHWRGAAPVLVRPVKARCAEEDWFVGGADIRKPESWVLKGICADNA